MGNIPSVNINDMCSKEVIGIDCMKFFFAICVVAIHTHPYSNYTSTPFTVERILDILLLCAVPFFFITTGYFIGKKLSSLFSDEKNESVLKYYLLKYLKLYLIWTIAYLPITLYYYMVISSQKSFGLMLIDFLRGLILLGEHWNSWMLWYLLSMIYALIIFSLIRLLKGSFGVVYVISVVIFILSAVFDCFSNISNTGFVIKSFRFLLGENARLFTAPFYVSMGMIIGRIKNITLKSSLGVGVPLTLAGFLIKLSKKTGGGNTLNVAWQCVR